MTRFPSITRKTAAISAVVLTALTVSAAAVAGTITASAAVTGAGALGLSHGASATVPAVTLDGTDQNAVYTIPLSITDARGNGSGWNGTITSTSFNDGAGHTLATTASSLTGATSACVAGGTCTNPTNAITYPLAVPAGSTAPTAVKFFDAAANTGMGRFTITPSITVSVPGNVYAGTYSSTVTVAVASGP
ncbi:MAG: WxL domain-containing protein [Gaiellaceae bacterium]